VDRTAEVTDLAIPEERDDNLRIERHIWRHIGKQSVREMAAELGVSPEAVLKVKRDMVDSVDDITVQVQRMKLLKQLQELADSAQDRIEGASTEFFAGIVNSSVGAIKALLVELNRTKSQADGAAAALNDLRKREIVAMYVEVVNKSVAEMAENYDLDKAEVFDIFNSNLQAAASKRDTE
jgi:DNA-binding transcriptional regulator YhcF (GntR family)